MNRRRTLDQALRLTPEQQLFVKRPLIKDRNPALTEQVAPVAHQEHELTVPPPKPAHVLVPLTTRLHPHTAEQLRRAYLHQKLNRLYPSTQQEIVEEAIRHWLCKMRLDE